MGSTRATEPVGGSAAGKGTAAGCLNHRSNPKLLRELSKSHQWWRKEEDAPRSQGEKDVTTQIKKSDEIKELIVVQNI